MIPRIIADKVRRSRINIQAFLKRRSKSSTRKQISFKKQPVLQATNLPQPSQQSLPQINNQKIPTTEIQLKALYFNNNTYKKQKQAIWLNFWEQEGILQILYEEKGEKYKLQIKRQQIPGAQIKANLNKFICCFKVKSLTIQREDKKLSQQIGQTIWSEENKFKKSILVLQLAQEAQFQKFIGLPFMQDLKVVRLTDSAIQNFAQYQQGYDQYEDYEQEDSKYIQLSLPKTQQQFKKSQETINLIKRMTQEQKEIVLYEILKIGDKQYDQKCAENKSFKCPILICQKSKFQFNDFNILNEHLEKIHPQLSRCGMRLRENGTFQFTNSKAIDMALYFSRCQPKQMKKIIRNAKQRKASQQQ